MNNFFRNIKYIAFLATVLAPAQTWANLIVNGSFEEALIDPGPYFVIIDSGSNNLTGWNISQGNIDYISGTWVASDGGRSIDLDGSWATGIIEQTFATTAGETYLVKFDMAGNFGGGSSVKSLEVSADAQFSDFDFNTVGYTVSDMGWTTIMWSFVADDDFSTLRFTSLTADSESSYGAAIDNVIVSAVPVPAAVWLFGSGLIGLIGFAKRKKVYNICCC